MQREIIRFNGHPVQLRLDRDPAKAVAKRGARGVEYQITCNDDTSIMWLDPDAHAALLHTGAAAGDAISIQKAREGWQVRKLGAPAPAPQPLPERAYYQPQPAQAAIAVPPANQAEAFGVLAGCLCAAIEAAAEAQSYATRKQLPLQFTGEDVRAMALTLYIQAAKGGR